jgi:hypothetical protein
VVAQPHVSLFPSTIVKEAGECAISTKLGTFPSLPLSRYLSRVCNNGPCKACPTEYDAHLRMEEARAG